MAVTHDIDRDDLEKLRGECVQIVKRTNGKANFLSAQGKESKPQNELVTTFSPEEIELLKAEAFKRYGNGKPKYK